MPEHEVMIVAKLGAFIGPLSREGSLLQRISIELVTSLILSDLRKARAIVDDIASS